MISRGVSTGSTNLFVFAQEGQHQGVGECAPGAGYDETLAPLAEEQLGAFCRDLEETSLSVHEVWRQAREREIAPPAQAALDTALWDLLAKQAGLPLYRLLGLPRRAVATSVTAGINPPDVMRERVREVLERTGGKALKVKLGNPEGIEADQASFEAARAAAEPFGVKIRVDANGGWSPRDAETMIAWLAERGVEYVEQPLPEGSEDDLVPLFRERKLPIFIDESCRTSEDVARFADRVDGVNLKLMKCGGITEATRIVATARAHGLKTMIGCMGESSVAIAAGAAIGALFDYIDLDSQLNLNPDPAHGLEFEAGVVLPPERPGHGADLTDA
jgi:L-Ala-D/L-Glu epimerase